MARIFLVEDNKNLREAVASYLSLNNHGVVEFGRTQGVMEAMDTRAPDLVILDVMLPDSDGFHLAKRIRKDHDVPIIFLTARTSESDRVTGFELGGDDYVVKPFSPKELVLRVEAVLKRSGSNQKADAKTGRWELGGAILELNQGAHRATLDGNEVNLTTAEWSILSHLAINEGIVISREKLLGECLDYMIADQSERTIDTHIKNIRAKISDGGWIKTIRGFGYRFAGRQV